MADVHTPEQRRRNMSSIRGKDTTPEKKIRSMLHAMGFRFRLHAKALPGTPDIVLPKYKTLIFVHGCFWHRHKGCRYTTTPGTRVKFWEEKFRRNVERDEKNKKDLIKAGWRVLVVWECEVRNGTEKVKRRFSTIKKGG